MDAPAIFSGAGLSGAPPASMPLGFALRDRVLDFMYAQAQAYAPAVVTADELKRLRVPARKLEQVLGRLWRVVGNDALECLYCLQPAAPNEAHHLAALHLARGGTHVTLNFDRGIEDAYARLAAPPLRTVTTRDEFDDWLRDGRPPALLKPHGGLAPGATALLDVVVEDTEELGGLHPSRLAAIEALGAAPSLLITGYGGLDPDVYGPLLQAAARTRTTWATKTADDEVCRDCNHLGIELVDGDPAGLASTALRELLGLPEGAVAVDEVVSEPWAARFDAWGADLARRHDGAAFAHAWAWLLADAGDRDRAAVLLRHTLARDPSDGVRLRLADVLYDRARDDDRIEALRIYRGLAVRRGLGWPTRAHCVLRVGGVARGQAVHRPGWRSLPALGIALLAPVLVLARRGGDAESTAAAHGVLGQTVLRGVEGAATMLPPATRPALAPALRWAARHCERAAETTLNGNRRALATSHRLLALALAGLFTGTELDPAWEARLRALAAAYVNAGDLAGAGNCMAALAVVAAAAGDLAVAGQHLDVAAGHYAEGRAAGELIPSGAALLLRLRVLLLSDR